MPTSHGFDEYYGIPYSVDMGSSAWHGGWPPLPLLNGLDIIEQPVNLSNLSIRYTEEANKFITKSVNNKQSFVLYMAHNHVHIPDYSSPEYCNKSIRGFFGNTLSEVDQQIGDIMQHVEDLGIVNNTLVFFTSDNGPWLQMKLAGGSAGLFRDGKFTTWEGGVSCCFCSMYCDYNVCNAENQIWIGLL